MLTQNLTKLIKRFLLFVLWVVVSICLTTWTFGLLSMASTVANIAAIFILSIWLVGSIIYYYKLIV